MCAAIGDARIAVGYGSRMRIAVIGHVEHVTLGRVDAVPNAGDIVHLQDAHMVAAGGGALAFWQLVRSDAEVHFFTAVGDDDGGRIVREQLGTLRAGVTVHVATRAEPHPRVVVMVDRAGRRTIVVTAPPLQPREQDTLPWSLLSICDAVYFTGSDPGSLRRAREGKRLLVTARRRPVVETAQVAPDVVIGSVSDPRENAPLDAWSAPPGALVLTDGPRPIRVVRGGGTTFVDPPPAVVDVVSDYGAGDSFSAALTYFLACGRTLEDAVRAAGPFGAAILGGPHPLERQAMLG